MAIDKTLPRRDSRSWHFQEKATRVNEETVVTARAQ